MAKRLSWATRLERAEERGRFTDTEIKFARDSWLTCAVGERHDWKLAPMTLQEDVLGWEFGFAVQDQDIFLARSLYEQIMALPKGEE